MQPMPPATQTRHPWRATLRTVVQVGVPAFIALVFVLPEVLRVILDGMGATLPDSVRAWLAGAAAVVTAAGATLTRIMAIPGVDRWLTDHLGGVFSAEPRKY